MESFSAIAKKAVMRTSTPCGAHNCNGMHSLHCAAKTGGVSMEAALKELHCVPLVERACKLDEAAEALRHLIEDRPFGRVVVG